jgi:hypothetical protein
MELGLRVSFRFGRANNVRCRAPSRRRKAFRCASGRKVDGVSGTRSSDSAEAGNLEAYSNTSGIMPRWLMAAKKKAGPELLPSQLSGFNILRRLSTGGNNDDDGGGSNDARRTSSMKAYNNHSTDTVGSIRNPDTHNRNPDSRIHNPGSRIRSPDSHSLQTQFRPKPEHRNAALKQKRIHLPPMQLREPFSNSLFYLPQMRNRFSFSIWMPHLLLSFALPRS